MTNPFGFGPSGPFDMNALGQALQQLGQMMQASQGQDGPVQWAIVEDVARKAAPAGANADVSQSQREAVASAVSLADLWLDDAVTFPAAPGPSEAWTRVEWIERTGPVWRRVVSPIAEKVTGAVANIVPGSGELEEISAEDVSALLPEHLRDMMPEGVPAEFMQMLKPMLDMVKQLGSAAFSMQVGQVLAGLSEQVLCLSDIGIPLLDPPKVALVPENVSKFAESLGVSGSDALMFVALREAAHQRLFAHVPWLAARVMGSVEQYASHMDVDGDRLEEAMHDVDMTNPGALQEILSGGLLNVEDSIEQKAAVARLEALLACIEGWVDEVVQQAAADRLPSFSSLMESMRRRRASGGPAEKTFASMLGMELRPRQLREAHTVFAAIRSQRGSYDRDALWSHPDLLPGAEELADPLGFVASSGQVPDTLEGWDGPAGDARDDEE